MDVRNFNRNPDYHY